MPMLHDFTRRHFLLTGMAAAAAAQDPGTLLRRAWTAKWIAVPGSPARDYAVSLFRRTFELPSAPARFPVHVTADNRYQLFVNGRRVCWGPARGDMFHWRYETLDLAPWLRAGRNVLAALAWNFGELAPEAQITDQAGFLLEGDGEPERVAGTGPAWKCMRAEAYTPLPFTSGEMRGYYVAGPGDRVDARRHPWGWEEPEFDDSVWSAARIVSDAAGREASDPHSRWMLVERTIPPMEERPERLAAVRRASGIPSPAGFPAAAEPVRIPGRTRATLLLDQGYLTTAYPELTVSGGRDSVVRLGYAETLFQPAAAGRRGFEKGNRNEVEGKEFIGNRDEFVADGGSRRRFRPLWWRTYRYLELSIETGDEPLMVEDLAATAVGYPFERRARFEGGGPEIERILDTGWRTARLCAHETYMDCPYYEQLQYVGDTRVQCLVSLFNSGDARLMRNAIELIDNSRQSDGCTMSRYPTRLEQYIPAFALWWIGMVRDYWWYADEPGFVRFMLPGVRAVLAFFERHQKDNGSLGPLPWWRYMDWVPEWPRGEAPQEGDGSSACFDLLHAMACGWAADLEQAMGIPSLAGIYGRRADQIRATAQALYWDPGRRFFADTPRKASFSEHANVLAILSETIRGSEARDLALRVLAAPGLARTSLFFRFYLHQAVAKIGEGDRYLDQLGDWRSMLADGLTTFAETVDRPGVASRSDCHAWSASPNIEVFRTVLGVDSAAPGFRQVSVKPHLGALPFARGSVPHPSGSVDVQIDPAGANWRVAVTLPSGVTGNFEWRNQRRELRPGENRFTI